MKTTFVIILMSILLLNTTAFADLTPTDLKNIDDLIKASEARIKEYVDLKIDALDKKFTGEIKTLDKKFTGEIKALDGRVTQIYGVLIALIALIAVAVGLPQYLLARRGKEMQTYMEKIDALSREIENLKQKRIVSS